jgi:hypothetical protein
MRKESICQYSSIVDLSHGASAVEGQTFLLPALRPSILFLRLEENHQESSSLPRAHPALLVARYR